MLSPITISVFKGCPTIVMSAPIIRLAKMIQATLSNVFSIWCLLKIYIRGVYHGIQMMSTGCKGNRDVAVSA
jgi:hypothetical protein